MLIIKIQNGSLSGRAEERECDRESERELAGKVKLQRILNLVESPLSLPLSALRSSL